MKERFDWTRAQALYDTGNTITSCCAALGCTYGAWLKAVKRGRVSIKARMFADGRRRHNWSDVQSFYDEGHSLAECIQRFRFCRGAWHKAVRRGEIRPRPLASPLDIILAKSRSRRTIKVRLLQAGILQNQCDLCGISEWQGEAICIQIDHINGIRTDHRVENLRMLCPNCHSQTATYGRRRCRLLQEPPEFV